MATFLVATAKVGAQGLGYTERAKKYVDEYSTLAILEQKKSGIPAAITLAQGILETEAGASELMVEANNHFGIKCKNGWQGPTYSHDDDAPNECFKKYSCAAESFSDHSALLLRNPRYAPLLKIPQTDYAGWARCLKKCGYATSPTYAERLIRIVQDFELQNYTYTALDSSLSAQFASSRSAINAISGGDTAKGQPASQQLAVNTVPVSPLLRTADSARAFVMRPAASPAVVAAKPAPKDTLLNRSVKPGMQAVTVAAPVNKPNTVAVTRAVTADTAKRAAPANPVVASMIQAPTPAVAAVQEKPKEESHLVIVNGLQAFYAHKDEMILQYAMKYHVGYRQLLVMNDLPDGPLPFDMYVYLERKLTKGANAQHILGEGESLIMAAQAEGMQVKALRDLNLLNPNEEPAPGTVLELQHPANRKPNVLVNQTTAHTRNAIVMNNEPAGAGEDLIDVRKIAAPDNGHAAVKTGATYADTARPKQINESPVAREIRVSDASTQAPGNSMKNSGNPGDSLIVSSAVYKVPVTEQPVAVAAKPAPVMTTRVEKYYTVKKGDTAFSIAKNNNITLAQLMKWNNIDGHITIGQNLQVQE